MQTSPGGVLALDISSFTGWAYGSDAHTLPSWGVWELSGIKNIAESCVGLANELIAAVRVLQPKRIVYEAPLTNAGHRVDPKIPFLLIGLAAHVESEAYRLSIPCRHYHSSEIRKLVLGLGNFSKPLHGKGKVRQPRDGGTARLVGDAKEEVKLWTDRVGWASITNHNARDAAVLLRYELMYSDAKITAGWGSNERATVNI